MGGTQLALPLGNYIFLIIVCFIVVTPALLYLVFVTPARFILTTASLSAAIGPSHHLGPPAVSGVVAQDYTRVQCYSAASACQS